MAEFVGRKRELATLVARLDAALAGDPTVCLITGEPGIGKTRLARELVREAEARQCRILWSRCWEGPGAPPLWPWREILDRDDPLPVPADRLETDDDRFVVFEAVASRLRAAAEDQPTVLVLDDLHWADPLSLSVLQFVAQHVRAAPLMVAGTYREADARVSTDSSMLGRLTRHATMVPLRGLTASEVRALVADLHGATLAPATLSALQEATAGNPFFVEEVVQLVLAEVERDGFDPRRVPDSVREATRQRLELLTGGGRDLLRTASALGREFAPAVIEGITRMARSELVSHIDAAAAAGLLEATGDRFRFTHALVREALYADLDSAELLDIHRRAADALERFYEGDLDAHAAELAHHFAQAQAPREAVKAARYDLTAGYEALRRFAYEQADEHATHGLRAVASLPEPDLKLRADLYLLQAEARLRLSDPDGLKEAARRAAGDARAAGSNEHLARAAIAYGSMAAAWAADAEGLELCESALDAVGATRADLRARVLCSLAWMHVTAGDLDAADRPSERALELARQIDVHETLCRALYVRQEVFYGTAKTAEQVRLADELVSVAERHDDVYWRAQGHRCRAVARLQLGDVAGFRADRESTAQLGATLRSRVHRSLAHSWSGVLALLGGRFDEVEPSANRALSVLRADPDALKAYASQLFWLRHEQGRLQEIEMMVDVGLEQEPRLAPVRAAAAHLHAEVGNPETARRHLDELLQRGLHRINRDWGWSMTITSVASVLALGAADTRAVTDADRGTAGTVADLLEPFRHQLVVVASATHVAGAFDRYRGMMLTLLERWDEAADAFEDALRLETRAGAPPLVSRSRYWYARMLLQEPEGDRERARDLLVACLDVAQPLRMQRLVEEAEKLYACV